ncbi:DUF6414 family protein [Halococcus qingdaonensis]|uniref:DUF6414 family protein n=1 Tax=Halococcus qingdaonensis TaxID=224402 RepID=UPI0021166304|nr:hypothetical protein [Halococcus qingdaonensis]
MVEAGNADSSAPPYVSDFVYLDMDEVKSISARMGGGFIKEMVEGDEEVNEVSKSVTARLMASVFGIGKAGIEGNVLETSGDASYEESVKGLHHYHFTLLQNRLEDAEGKWFHDLGDIRPSTSMSGDGFREGTRSDGPWDDISEGHIIRVDGNLEVSDMSTSLDLLLGILSVMSDSEKLEALGLNSVDMDETFDEDSPLADMDDDERKERMLDFFDTFSAFIPAEYEEMIFAELFPIQNNREQSIRLTIDESKLEDTPIELMTNYESNRIPNCTLVGRVKTITRNKSIELKDGLNNIGMMHHLTDELATEMGLKVSYPSISVKPIAIYR